MTDYEDKRELPRLLCNNRFINCRIEGNERTYCVTAVNFHHRGISLFSDDPLAGIMKAALSFDYQSDNNHIISIIGIPLTIVYANETDIGAQYGCKFDLSTVLPGVVQTLQAIETALQQEQNTDDRYGLFE